MAGDNNLPQTKKRFFSFPKRKSKSAPPPPSPDVSATSSASAKAAWALLKPYWVSKDDKWSKWALLGGVSALTLSQVAMSIWFTNWNVGFYNALQNYALPSAMHQLGLFTGMASVYTADTVATTYLQQKLQMQWRQSMTRSYVHKWLGDKTHYRLQQQPPALATDNPDQRIAEDITNVTAGTLNLGLGLLNSAASLVGFTSLLWKISGPLALAVAGHAVVIPGYLVWAALGYAGAGTYFTSKYGRKLIKYRRNQQRLEGDFRYNLIRTRTNAKEIAQNSGEPAEERVLDNKFGRLVGNWKQIMNTFLKVNGISSMYNQLGSIFPYAVVMPRYFAKQIQLGTLFQVAQAFSNVNTSVSWVINSYSDIADWRANVDRLTGFTKGLEAAAATADKGVQRVPVPVPTHDFVIRDLVVSRPGDESGADVPLVDKPFSVALHPGDRLLITGPTGSGKSTMLLAIQGLWPRSDGAIAWPDNAKVICVPQSAYIPNLPVADILSYPNRPVAGDEAKMAEVLTAVGLEKLIPMIGKPDGIEGDQLTRQMSGGEKQKLAFARAFLLQPDIVMLDEATSALDPASNEKLYRMLIERMPQATIISVAHRGDVKQFHTLHADIDTKERAVSLYTLPPMPPPGGDDHAPPPPAADGPPPAPPPIAPPLASAASAPVALDSILVPVRPTAAPSAIVPPPTPI